MSGDERNWISEAIAQCKSATEAKLTIALVRLQDSNDEADIVITNASPEMLQGLSSLLCTAKKQYDDEE